MAKPISPKVFTIECITLLLRAMPLPEHRQRNVINCDDDSQNCTSRAACNFQATLPPKKLQLSIRYPSRERFSMTCGSHCLSSSACTYARDDRLDHRQNPCTLSQHCNWSCMPRGKLPR